MLDEAVAAGIEESDALDRKRDLPDEKALAQSDVVKDIAAFANRLGRDGAATGVGSGHGGHW
jgi:hypothetical protein